MAKVQNIVFDLGGVLLDLDFEAPIKAFGKLSLRKNIPELFQLLKNELFIGFETGKISAPVFREELRKYLKNPGVTDIEIDNAWCSILKSIPEIKVKLLKELSTKYQLFLYSNTNAIHISRFQREFIQEHATEWTSLFDKIFYSHKINDRKPTLTGFRHVISLAEIVPQQSLFIDDLEMNIVAAAQTGFQTLHYLPGTDLGNAIKNAIN
jgi:putative hydrolase of the HAD superfamily